MQEVRLFSLRRRFVAAAACLVLSFLFLLVRLVYLQGIEGESYGELSENNRFRTVFLPPPRGIIYDREGHVLAKNRASFNIEFIKADSPNPEKTIADLARLLNIDAKKINAQLLNQKRRHRFEPKVAVLDASRSDVAKVLSRRHMLPGVYVAAAPQRLYTEGSLAAHAIGYTREISPAQLKQERYAQNTHGDLVGQSGIETQKEELLQGMRGSQRVVVDARGARVSSLPPMPEKIGQPVTITIDLPTQRAADDALDGLKGAIVAMDARTGEILAMSSAPSYDPNVFTRQVDSKIWKDLNNPEMLKLNNRAIQGTYPPGSVFKVFMAVAALAEKVTNTQERVHCPGSYRVGSRVFRCHKKSGHGSVNLEEALTQSCDVYFYVMGQRLGVDRIYEWAQRFGLGQVTGIELAEEKKGLIPSTEWKRRAFKKREDQKWYPGETPSVVIGQGAVSTTPLQITRAMAALANGGSVLRPHLFLDSENSTSYFISKVGAPPEVMKTVSRILQEVVYDDHGTGKKSQLSPTFNISVAGKTGTAQPASLNLQHLGEHLNDHAWFSAFAPADDPEIAVTALVENGGHGGAVAAPLVRKVMEAYFRARGREESFLFAGPEFESSEEAEHHND